MNIAIPFVLSTVFGAFSSPEAAVMDFLERTGLERCSNPPTFEVISLATNSRLPETDIERFEEFASMECFEARDYTLMVQQGPGFTFHIIGHARRG